MRKRLRRDLVSEPNPGAILRYPHKLDWAAGRPGTGSTGFWPASHAAGSMPPARDLRLGSQETAREMGRATAGREQSQRGRGRPESW